MPTSNQKNKTPCFREGENGKPQAWEEQSSIFNEGIVNPYILSSPYGRCLQTATAVAREVAASEIFVEYSISEGPFHIPGSLDSLKMMQHSFSLIDEWYQTQFDEPRAGKTQHDVLPRCAQMSQYISEFFRHKCLYRDVVVITHGTVAIGRSMMISNTTTYAECRAVFQPDTTSLSDHTMQHGKQILYASWNTSRLLLGSMLQLLHPFAMLKTKVKNDTVIYTFYQVSWQPSTIEFPNFWRWVGIFSLFNILIKENLIDGNVFYTLGNLEQYCLISVDSVSDSIWMLCFDLCRNHRYHTCTHPYHSCRPPPPHL